MRYDLADAGWTAPAARSETNSVARRSILRSENSVTAGLQAHHVAGLQRPVTRRVDLNNGFAFTAA